MSIGLQEILIAGLFTVLGGIINALIVKYGLPSFTRKKLRIIKGKGFAKDISLCDKSNLFGGDSTDTYQINDAKVTINDSSINLEARVVSTKPNDNFEMIGDIKGVGHYVDGVGYLIYEGTYDNSDIHWTGVMVLNMPRAGNITGYWITEKTVEKGVFSFGEAIIERV